MYLSGQMKMQAIGCTSSERKQKQVMGPLLQGKYYRGDFHHTFQFSFTLQWRWISKIIEVNDELSSMKHSYDFPSIHAQKLTWVDQPSTAYLGGVHPPSSPSLSTHTAMNVIDP